MKILQINAVYKCLSTGTNVYEINTLLNQVGHQCVAAFSDGKITDPEREYKIGRTGGQKLHALLSRVTGLQGYFSRHATKKLLRYMDAFQPDVVVLNNLHANYIHLPKLLTYLAEKDIPTVAVLHDCWFYTGKCCYYTTANCNKWQTGCENCPAWKKHNKSWFFDRTKKMHRDRIRLFSAIPRLGVVAVSDWLLEQAKQSPVFANAKYITRVHNWIDTDVFTPTETVSLGEKEKSKGRKLILGVAAIWETRKGLDTLLWLAEQLTDEADVILVGKLPGNRKYSSNVHIIPATSNQAALAKIYAAADVFVQPSLEETFGKVTAEALACGTPVVCFDSTANPELVGEGCGAIVRPGDWEAMLHQVRNILQNGKESYTRQCRASALERFNKADAAKNYEACFARLQARGEKIVQINATCGNGSTGKIALFIGQLLDRKGIENYIFYSSGHSDYKNGIRYTSKYSVKVHALISRVLGNYGFENKCATRKLIAYLKSIKPDIIHIHNVHSHDCDLEMLFDYIRRMKIKVYWTFHDCWAFTGYCPHFDAIGCEQWKTQCQKCPLAHKFSWFFDCSRTNFNKKKALFRDVDLTIITPSQWLADQVQQSFLKGTPTHIISNGIDLSVFQPRESDFRQKYNCEEKFILLGVAFGWNDKKGLDVFMELAKRLDTQYQIVLVGTNEKIDKKLPSNIISIHRTQNQKELTQIYSAADLMVNPTREDTYPTVNMEAIACGTPVLTFDAGGSGEILDETCGCIVPKNDIDRMQREILRISKDRPYSQESCLKKAKQFNQEDKFVQYVDLYKV